MPDETRDEAGDEGGEESEVEGHFMSMGGIPTKPITITIPPAPPPEGKTKTYDFTSDSIEGCVCAARGAAIDGRADATRRALAAQVARILRYSRMSSRTSSW